MTGLSPRRLAALLSSVVVVASSGAATAQTSPMYVNCENRFAVIFPAAPMVSNISYTTRTGATAPARQFSLDQGGERYVVTIVDFSNGPAVDEDSVEHAAVNLRRRGEVRFQAAAPYDPGMPGRQLNIFERSDRQLRASVYMADHRLYITEASGAPGSFPALQFEQSITLIDGAGADLDRAAAGAEQRVFPCR